MFPALVKNTTKEGGGINDGVGVKVKYGKLRTWFGNVDVVEHIERVLNAWIYKCF